MRLIDADKLECVAATMPKDASDDYKEGYGDGMNYVLDIIDDLPTIEPVKRGRWVKAERDGCLTYSDAYKQCSECGNVTFLAEKMNYCPWCGARMQEGEKE